MVWAALISFVIGNQSCGDANSKQIIKTEIVSNDNQNVGQQSNQNSDSIVVAPMFIHGEGIGVFGCVVIMPPVFINEADAKQIILNEFKKANLNFENKYSDNIPVSRKLEKYEYSNSDWKKIDTLETSDLSLDGYCKELNFAFEFVSSEDYEKFANSDEGLSSVAHENYINAAENIRKALKKNNKVNSVIFYEPLPRINRNENLNYDEYEKIGRQKSEEQLKLQVADFINWLKKEKFIKN